MIKEDFFKLNNRMIYFFLTPQLDPSYKRIQHTIIQ